MGRGCNSSIFLWLTAAQMTLALQNRWPNCGGDQSSIWSAGDQFLQDFPRAQRCNRITPGEPFACIARQSMSGICSLSPIFVNDCNKSIRCPVHGGQGAKVQILSSRPRFPRKMGHEQTRLVAHFLVLREAVPQRRWPSVGTPRSIAPYRQIFSFFARRFGPSARESSWFTE